MERCGGHPGQLTTTGACAGGPLRQWAGAISRAPHAWAPAVGCRAARPWPLPNPGGALDGSGILLGRAALHRPAPVFAWAAWLRPAQHQSGRGLLGPASGWALLLAGGTSARGGGPLPTPTLDPARPPRGHPMRPLARGVLPN
ncbi:hypothetical protein Tco_1040926 [Tanacetum coccineum]|uniref:Uncharacterized protein n=1 Tax=Tanacetum coccineum TaxID=301880 RepID=A0ABQ5GG75_9ASTR